MNVGQPLLYNTHTINSRSFVRPRRTFLARHRDEIWNPCIDHLGGGEDFLGYRSPTLLIENMCKTIGAEPATYR